MFNAIRRARNTALAVALHGLAWGLIFVSPEAIFWDDWTLLSPKLDEVLAAFEANGHPSSGYLHFLVLQGGPWVSRTLNFAAQSLTIIFMSQVLGNFEKSLGEYRYIGLYLMAVLPIFQARWALIFLPLVISFFVFSVGWFLWSRTNVSKFQRLLALPFMVFSAWSHVALVAILPMVFLLELHNRELKPVRDRFKLMFEAIPVAIGAALILYHQLTIRHSVGTGYEGYQSLKTPEAYIVAALAVVIFGAGLLVLQLNSRLGHEGPQIFLAVACAIFAFLPYVAYGKVPPFYEWQTRYEGILWLVSPVVISLFIAPLMGRLSLRRISFGAVGVLLVLGLLGSVGVSIGYLRDWSKQKALIQAFHALPPGGNEVLLVSDSAKADNLFSRDWRYYELQGMLRISDPGTRRLAISTSSGWGVEDYERFMATPNPLKWMYETHHETTRIQPLEVFREVEKCGDIEILFGAGCYGVSIGKVAEWSG